MQFRQIRSGFNDPDDKMFCCDFETWEELLSHDYINWYKRQPSFTRFSLADQHTLMAEYRDGFEWWVVGYINYPSSLHLPEWRAKYYARLEGKEVILIDEVISSCGSELTLRDGRRLKIYDHECNQCTIDCSATENRGVTMSHKHCVFCGESSDSDSPVCLSPLNPIPADTVGNRPHGYPADYKEMAKAAVERIASPKPICGCREYPEYGDACLLPQGHEGPHDW
jgi:hypothetical protein